MVNGGTKVCDDAEVRLGRVSIPENTGTKDDCAYLFAVVWGGE